MSEQKVVFAVVSDLDGVAASPVAVLILAKVTVNGSVAKFVLKNPRLLDLEARRITLWTIFEPQVNLALET